MSNSFQVVERWEPHDVWPFWVGLILQKEEKKTSSEKRPFYGWMIQMSKLLYFVMSCECCG